MLGGLKTKAADTAKRAGLLTGGLLAIAIGLAFLTAAAWIYLVSVTDTQTAALIIGGAFTGLGLLVIGIASSKKSEAHIMPEAHAVHQPTGAMNGQQPPLMQAFFHGMQAGVNATQNRR